MERLHVDEGKGDRMSKIVNEPKNTFPLFVKVREQLEHRALWLYPVSYTHLAEVLDSSPVLLPKQYEFWQWLAEYYLCTLGRCV